MGFDARREDLTIPDHGLELEIFRDKNARSIRGSYGPGVASGQFRQRADVPMVWDDWSASACVSQTADGFPGCYATGRKIWNRSRNVLINAGAVTEVPIILTTDGSTTIRPGACTAIFESNGHLYFAMGRYVVRVEKGTERVLGYGKASNIVSSSLNGGLDLGANARADNAVAFGKHIYLGTNVIDTTITSSWAITTANQNAVLWKLIGDDANSANIGTWTKRRDGAAGASTISGTGGGVQTNVRLNKLGSVYLVDGLGVPAQRLFGVLAADLQDPPSTGPTFKARRCFIHASEGREPLTSMQAGIDGTGTGDPWSAVYRVAGETYDVNSLAVGSHHIYFCTIGGIADVDGRGYSPIMTPYWQQNLDTHNGQASLIDEDFIYANHGFGLDRVAIGDGPAALQQTPGYCGPGTNLSNETEIYGRCTAITKHGGWLVGAFFNGHDSFIMVGQDKRAMGRDVPVPVVWLGPEAVLEDQMVTKLKITQLSADTPRLWIASIASDEQSAADPTTGRIWWMSIPNGISPVQEYLNNRDSSNNYTGRHRFAKDWSITFTAADWGRQVSEKVIHRTDIRGDFLSSSSYLRAYAAAEDGQFYQQGTGPQGLIADPKAQVSPRSELLPAQSLPAGHNLTIRLDATCPDAAQPDQATGNPTSATTNTLVDTTKNWDTNVLVNAVIIIVSGTGSGQSRVIGANDGTTLTLTQDWGTIPDATSSYEIFFGSNVGTLTDATNFVTNRKTILVDTTKAWTANQWVGYVLEITSGTANGQSRVIVGNDATSITIAPNLLTTPDSTTTYSITRGYTLRPVILREVSVRAGDIAEPRDTRQYRIVLGAARSQRNTTQDTRDPMALWRRLVALLVAKPFYMIDEMGERGWWRMEESLGYTEVSWRREGSEKDERILVADVEFSRIPSTPEELSLLSTVGTSNTFDEGILRWDSGESWDSEQKWR